MDRRRFRSWLSYLVVLHTGLVPPEQLLGQKECQQANGDARLDLRPCERRRTDPQISRINSVTRDGSFLSLNVFSPETLTLSHMEHARTAVE